MSVYMTSYLIRLIMLNPNVSIFNEVKDKIQTGSQYDTNDNCSQAKLLTPILLLFSEKFTDYSSQIKKDDFDGLANKKVVTADDRINFLQGPVLERLRAIDRDINPTLYISIDKTIQEEAIDFLNNTIVFINKNKNLYQPIDQLNGNNETRKQFEERKKEYSKQANRLKFGYANKLYIKYKAKKLHENVIRFHDWSDSHLIPNFKNLLNNYQKKLLEFLNYK